MPSQVFRKAADAPQRRDAMTIRQCRPRLAMSCVMGLALAASLVASEAQAQRTAPTTVSAIIIT